MSEQIKDQQRLEIEAAVYRRLVAHLQAKTDVQNIDLMNLADFCRNCLSKWYVSAAEDKNISLDYEEARKFVYGMPYSEWKDKYQKEANPEQLSAFSEAEKRRKSK